MTDEVLIKSMLLEMEHGYISYGNLHGEDDRGIRLIAKALEKQIPKNPIFEGDGYADGEMVYDTWFCPNCNKDYEVDYDDYDFCPNCGQAIDWSEVEE